MSILVMGVPEIERILYLTRHFPNWHYSKLKYFVSTIYEYLSKQVKNFSIWLFAIIFLLQCSHCDIEVLNL